MHALTVVVCVLRSLMLTFGTFAVYALICLKLLLQLVEHQSQALQSKDYTILVSKTPSVNDAESKNGADYLHHLNSTTSTEIEPTIGSQTWRSCVATVIDRPTRGAQEIRSEETSRHSSGGKSARFITWKS